MWSKQKWGRRGQTWCCSRQRKKRLLLIIGFYFNKNINTLEFNILIEIQMLICVKNLGNILNIYENSFVLKWRTMNIVQLISSLRILNIPILFHVTEHCCAMLCVKLLWKFYCLYFYQRFPIVLSIWSNKI